MKYAVPSRPHPQIRHAPLGYRSKSQNQTLQEKRLQKNPKFYAPKRQVTKCISDSTFIVAGIPKNRNSRSQGAEICRKSAPSPTYWFPTKLTRNGSFKKLTAFETLGLVWMCLFLVTQFYIRIIQTDQASRPMPLGINYADSQGNIRHMKGRAVGQLLEELLDSQNNSTQQVSSDLSDLLNYDISNTTNYDQIILDELTLQALRNAVSGMISSGEIGQSNEVILSKEDQILSDNFPLSALTDQELDYDEMYFEVGYEQL